MHVTLYLTFLEKETILSVIGFYEGQQFSIFKHAVANPVVFNE